MDAIEKGHLLKNNVSIRHLLIIIAVAIGENSLKPVYYL